jgi:hypothetical protein
MKHIRNWITEEYDYKRKDLNGTYPICQWAKEMHKILSGKSERTIFITTSDKETLIKEAENQPDSEYTGVSIWLKVIAPIIVLPCYLGETYNDYSRPQCAMVQILRIYNDDARFDELINYLRREFASGNERMAASDLIEIKKQLEHIDPKKPVLHHLKLAHMRTLFDSGKWFIMYVKFFQLKDEVHILNTKEIIYKKQENQITKSLF